MERILECKKHGLAKHKRRIDRGKERWRCSKCEYDAVKRRRRKLKEKLVLFHGGKCIKCGYKKSLRALSFHHRNREEKSFSINMAHRVKWDTLLEESKKCDLLCANCHMEIEEERDLSVVANADDR